MLKWIDRSPALAQLLEKLSSLLARQRGLPVIIGIILVSISFVIQLVNLAAHSALLDLLWTICHHLGIIIALIGILLVEPLGQ